MTRSAQKIAERQTLERVLAARGLRPDHEPQEGEAPDFTISMSGQVIGVEITAYQSDAIVNDGTKLRLVESEWERLKAAADAFRHERRELREINIGLMFKDRVPSWRDHAAFLEEVAAFVRTHFADLRSQTRAYWPQEFSSPLMVSHLRTLLLRKGQHPEWYSNIPAGFVDRPGYRIAKIVAEKSKRQFRPAAELWLVIECRCTYPK